MHFFKINNLIRLLILKSAYYGSIYIQFLLENFFSPDPRKFQSTRTDPLNDSYAAIDYILNTNTIFLIPLGNGMHVTRQRNAAK
jgi:hypothetical protein